MRKFIVFIEGRESRTINAKSEKQAIQKLVENNIIDPEKERFSLEEMTLDEDGCAIESI